MRTCSGDLGSCSWRDRLHALIWYTSTFLEHLSRCIQWQVTDTNKWPEVSLNTFLSCYSSVTTVTRLRVKRPSDQGSIPCKDKKYFSTCQDRLWHSLNLLSSEYWVILLFGSIDTLYAAFRPSSVLIHFTFTFSSSAVLPCIGQWFYFGNSFLVVL